ncbi:conserved fungal protein [Mucor ambiguus]|uniref:Conserved fungal protein n=1 Tax=Mucor ambiguus TaxID=91626 RepID=A0A0C9MKA9_9FUNG|nr:conserved fungal protein [Mucor ambiguus]
MIIRHAIRRHISSKKNLSSFLEQTDKDVTSTVYRGTLFELQTLETLATTAGMDLEHVGGKSDRGIDLRGQWFNDISILVQCKNTKQGCTPDQIRELIGTVASSTSPTRRKIIGILSIVNRTQSNNNQFTPDVLQQFRTSTIALGLVTIENTTLKTIMFNKKAQSMLKGLSISTQYSPSGDEALVVNIPSNNDQ